VASSAPRQHTDVSEGDLLGELATDEVGGASGGSVAAIGEGGLQILSRGLRSKEHGSPPGTEGINEFGCGVGARRESGQLVPTSGGAAKILEGMLRG
jgi:hypothetical protein